MSKLFAKEPGGATVKAVMWSNTKRQEMQYILDILKIPELKHSAMMDCRFGRVKGASLPLRSFENRKTVPVKLQIILQ